MSYQIKANYNKVYLLPPSTEDWVSEDHPARYIREFVDGLDLKKHGFKTLDNNQGRPYYSSNLLLKVWLFGYFMKVYSSRELERLTKEHLPMIWLTGEEKPDHNTLWRFFKDNKQQIKEIFKETVHIAMKMNLVSMVLNILDGTKIHSYSSDRGLRNKQQIEKIIEETLDKTLEETMRKMDEAGQRDKGYKNNFKLPEELNSREALIQKMKEAREEIEKEKVSKINPNEPKARVMKNEDNFRLSYNSQSVVDEKENVIVAMDITNDANDYHQLVHMIEETISTTGQRAERTIADSGYASAEELTKAEKSGYDVYVQIKGKTNLAQRKEDKYHASNFIYDKGKDIMICPESKELTYKGLKCYRKYKNKSRVFTGKEVCNDCALRELCRKSIPSSRDKKQYREIWLSPYYETVLRQRKINESPESVYLNRKRMLIERVFAFIKHTLKFKRYLYKGLESVKAQWGLLCTTYNLKLLYGKWVENKAVLA